MEFRGRGWREYVVWLCPLWWVYVWWINRWIRHDCDRNPIICRTDPYLHLGWLDDWASQ